MDFANAHQTMPNPMEVRVAIYCRLSRDDELAGESASIQNQRELLEQYCQEHGWEVVAVYQDDGFTGLNMNRPDLQRMIKAIERKQIDLVITKDLSRLGRNYLQTGQLLEEFFPKNRVRYIALNDNVDTGRENNEIAPFKNILNEFYSRDISKKTHSAFLTKARNGQFTGNIAPFGYMKSPENKNQLVIDEDTAWIVRKIFEYARNGHGRYYIARRLGEEEIPSPVWWNRQKGLRNKISQFEAEDPERGRFVWDYSTVSRILSSPAYIGAVASQKEVHQFKVGRVRKKNQEDWIIIEGMHEPIIDRETFEIVQEKTKNRRRPDAQGNFNLFSGLLKCGQCGSCLNIASYRGGSAERIFNCNKYHKYGVRYCSRHFIKYSVLYDVVLEQIRYYARLALENEDEVRRELMEKHDAGNQSEKEIIERSIVEDTGRIADRERLIARLYEDMIGGKISEDNFEHLLQKSQSEQETLKKRVQMSRERLERQHKEQSDTSRWRELIREYADIKELDSIILNQLVNKIVVHEDTDGDVKRQTVEIHFNFMQQTDKCRLIQ